MRIKNTFLKGRMNKDIDERLLPEGEYPHAENVRVIDSGDVHIGALENDLGNEVLTAFSLTNAVTIGCLSDSKNSLIYYFTTSDEKDLVVEYDFLNKVTTVVLESSTGGVLNFNRNYLITGLNKVVNEDGNKDVLLWTDDFNPPRIVNIKRAKTFLPDGFDEKDIAVIKNPPVFAPELTPVFTETLQENNLENKFLTFSYRYKYQDGYYSALSPYTNYFFIPSEFEVDFDLNENLGMINKFNGVVIDFNTGDKRVEEIELVVKESNSNVLWMIERFSKKEQGWGDNETQNFMFSNSKLYMALPEAELTRSFDNVPRLAKAQDMVGNRIIYGNFLEQYDIVDKFGEDILLNYSLSLRQNTLIPIDLGGSFSTGDTKFIVDLTDVPLKEGVKLSFTIKLDEDVHTGNFRSTLEYILPQDYASVDALVGSDEFINFVEVIMTNVFNVSYEVASPPENSEIINQIGFKIENLTLGDSTFTIVAPSFTFRQDDTPEDPTPDLDYTDIPSIWRFDDELTRGYYREIAVASSAHSNRSLEVGLNYMDEQGRRTTVLTSVDNTIYIPHNASVFQNKIMVQVDHKPPYWADRYSFSIKQNKDRYHTIFCNLFYEDGIYRWIKLQGDNKDKVKEGDYLIPKSDLSGVVTDLIKVKVLEVVTKLPDFLPNDVNDVIEEGGLYMKIKPTGLDINRTSFNYISASSSNKAKDGFPAVLVTEGSHGGAYINGNRPNDRLTTEAALDAVEAALALETPPNSTIAGFLDVGTGDFVDYKITQGTIIKVYIRNYESDGFNKVFDKRFTVSGNYDNFEEWWRNEVINLGDVSNDFAWTFVRYTSNNALALFVQGFESGSETERSKLQVDIQMTLSEGMIIFETEPLDEPEEIFYESSDVFMIEDGRHTGNIQNQTTDFLSPAICELSFFNCFTFGNGVESIAYRDKFNSNFLNIDLRPSSTSIEKYKEVRRFADLTYGAVYNEGTSINGLNEFNLSTANFKNDIEKRYGSIQKIVARDTDLIVFQEDKVSKVLYGKSVLNNVDGTGNLGKIEDVLGQQLHYPTEYGISTNPESFAQYADTMYFTDAKRGTPLKLQRDSISEIDYGMTNYFKDTFSDSVFNKKVGGYDPFQNQYVILPDGDIVNKILHIDCSDTVVRTGFNGEQVVYIDYGILTGDAGFSYSTNGVPVSFTLEWNDETFSTGFVGDDMYDDELIALGYEPTEGEGTGTLTFDKDVVYPTIAKLTIFSPFEGVFFTLTGSCIVGVPMTVINVVINDSLDVSENIISRYKWYTDDYTASYKNYILPFEDDYVTIFNPLTGDQGSGFIPSEGATISIESLKDASKSGEFMDGDRLGYLLSDTLYTPETLIDLLTEATFTIPSTTIFDNGDVLVTGEFVYDNPDDMQYLYLIWDYMTPPVAVNDTAYCNQGEVLNIPVKTNDTNVGDEWTMVIVTPPVHGTAVVNATGGVTYTHDDSGLLPDSFTYKYTNGIKETNVATVSLTIVIPCSEGIEFEGGEGTFSFDISFGLGIGECGISYNAFSIADEFSITWNGDVVATTGGAVSGTGTLLFEKTLAEPIIATVSVTALTAGTLWTVNGICPVPTP